MAYCPDDGIRMNAVCLDYHACYHCSECGAHWSYVDGSWEMGTTENCLVHNECATCQDRTNLLIMGAK